MDFAAMIQSWMNVIKGPNEETFRAEVSKPEATLGLALVGRVLAAIISAALGFLVSMMGMTAVNSQMQQMMQQMQGQQDMPPEMLQMMQLFTNFLNPTTVGVTSLIGIVLTPFIFLLTSGLYHLLAKMLGGRGSFGTFAYVHSAIWSPLYILQAVGSLVPLLNACVPFIVLIYGLVLNYFAVKSNYQLSDGKALTVIILWLVIPLFLFGCIAVVAGAALFAMVQEMAPQ